MSSTWLSAHRRIRKATRWPSVSNRAMKLILEVMVLVPSNYLTKAMNTNARWRAWISRPAIGSLLVGQRSFSVLSIYFILSGCICAIYAPPENNKVCNGHEQLSSFGFWLLAGQQTWRNWSAWPLCQRSHCPHGQRDWTSQATWRFGCSSHCWFVLYL